MRDTVNMETQGIPSVGLVHAPFEKLAGMQCQQLGMPNAPILIYPQDVPSKDSHAFMVSKARQVARQALEFLLRP